VQGLLYLSLVVSGICKQKERCAVADSSTCRGQHLIIQVMIAGPICQELKGKT
jgi:hypothetical protein